MRFVEGNIWANFIKSNKRFSMANLSEKLSKHKEQPIQRSWEGNIPDMFKEKHQACISLERMKNCKTMKSTARISAFTLCNWSSLEAFKKSDETDIWLICWK